jgi:hypothetical protein
VPQPVSDTHCPLLSAARASTSLALLLLLLQTRGTAAAAAARCLLGSASTRVAEPLESMMDCCRGLPGAWGRRFAVFLCFGDVLYWRAQIGCMDMIMQLIVCFEGMDFVQEPRLSLFWDTDDLETMCISVAAPPFLWSF